MYTLFLQSFRCYENFSCVFSQPIVAVIGPNGSGKTTLLEALSLFSPGRGLRSALSGALQKENTTLAWRVSLCIKSDTGTLTLDTYEEQKRRKIWVNQNPLKSQTQLCQWLSIAWPPAYEDDGLTQRRIYLNRLVFTLFPAYGNLLLCYDKALKQRQRLLIQEEKNAKWYESIEAILAQTGIQIFHERNRVLRLIQKAIDQTHTPLPKPLLRLEGTLESAFHTEANLDFYKQTLSQSRHLDQIKKSTSFGVHKTRFVIAYPSGRSIQLCSAGEKQGLLLSVALAVMRLLCTEYPEQIHFFLLDEVMAHLDPERQSWLWQELFQLNTRVWITGLPDLTIPSAAQVVLLR